MSIVLDPVARRMAVVDVVPLYTDAQRADLAAGLETASYRAVVIVSTGSCDDFAEGNICDG